MKTVLILLALTAMAFTAAAADVSGKWTGTFVTDSGEAQPAYIVIKQAGATLTGTAGPDEGQQWPIRNGKIDGNELSVEVQHPDSGMVFKVDLVLTGDRLKGNITGSQGAEAMSGKMDLGRVK